MLVFCSGYMPRTGAKIHSKVSICEYFPSSNRIEPPPHVTGWPCSISKKPSASLDASTRFSARSLSLKYLSTGALETVSLIFSKTSFCSWVQSHWQSCVSGGALALTFLKPFRRNFERYFTSSINLCTAGTSSSLQVHWMALRFIWIRTSRCSVWSVSLNNSLALLRLRFITRSKLS